MRSINIAIAGLGGRGYGLLKDVILTFDEVNVLGVCDLYEDRAQRGFESPKKWLQPMHPDSESPTSLYNSKFSKAHCPFSL